MRKASGRRSQPSLQRHGDFIIRGAIHERSEESPPLDRDGNRRRGFLFAALEERIIDGGPIHYQWLGMAFMFFLIAIAIGIAFSRKSGGGTGLPNA